MVIPSFRFVARNTRPQVVGHKNTYVQVGLQVGGFKYQATDWWL